MTTAGGTSAPFTLEFLGIQATAALGTPADADQASVNPGDEIVLLGSGFTTGSDILTRYVDSSGTLRYQILNPTAVNEDGTEATVAVPRYYNSAFTVRMPGADAEHLLQIVPVIEYIDGNGSNGSVLMRGLGFVEGNGSVYAFNGGSVTDGNTAAGPDVRSWFANDNDAVFFSVPVHGFGDFQVTTAGGSSQAITPNFLYPALGDLRDIAFDGTHIWVVRQAGEIRKIDPTSGESLATFALPPGGAANGIGLDIIEASISLGGTSVPAGSLLVSNWNGNPDQIFAVSAETGVVIATLPLQQNLDIIAIKYDARDGGRLFALDGSPTAIVEIDATTGGTLSSIDISGDINIGGGEGGLTIDPASGNFLVVGTNRSNLYEFSPEGALIRTIDLASSQRIGNELTGLAFDAAGNVLASSFATGLVYRFSLPSPAFLRLGPDSDSSAENVFGPRRAESSSWLAAANPEGELSRQIRAAHLPSRADAGQAPGAVEIWGQAVLETLEELEAEGVCVPELGPFHD